ncbi:MAG: cold shock domain-containing protein [Candidatus Bathyarchaeota archaeon]|nr:cold shock domain-containing protein [Candidatus Bathyarchaeota archaeon]
MKGTVRKWLYDQGFGFIKTNDSKKDIFCHSRDVKNCYDLDMGDIVEFELEKTDKGPRAINVKIVYN